MQVLEDHKIAPLIIGKYLSEMARAKSKDIQDLFEELDKYTISGKAIEKYLKTILSKGNAERIGSILKLLTEQKINEQKIEENLERALQIERDRRKFGSFFKS